MAKHRIIIQRHTVRIQRLYVVNCRGLGQAINVMRNIAHSKGLVTRVVPQCGNICWISRSDSCCKIDTTRYGYGSPKALLRSLKIFYSACRRPLKRIEWEPVMTVMMSPQTAHKYTFAGFTTKLWFKIVFFVHVINVSTVQGVLYKEYCRLKYLIFCSMT